MPQFTNSFHTPDTFHFPNLGSGRILEIICLAYIKKQPPGLDRDHPIVLTDLELVRPARLAEQEASGCSFRVFFKPLESTTEFTLSFCRTNGAGHYITLCRGQASLTQNANGHATDAQSEDDEGVEELRSDYRHNIFPTTGLEYGSDFQLLDRVKLLRSNRVRLNTVASRAPLLSTECVLDPCQLDAALHGALFAEGLRNPGSSGLGLPHRIGSVKIWPHRNWTDGISACIDFDRNSYSWNILQQSSRLPLLNIRGLHFTALDNARHSIVDPALFASSASWKPCSKKILGSTRANPLASANCVLILASENLFANDFLRRAKVRAQAVSVLLYDDTALTDRLKSAMEKVTGPDGRLTVIALPNRTNYTSLIDKAVRTVYPLLQVLQILSCETPRLPWDALICAEEVPLVSGTVISRPPIDSLLMGLAPAFAAEHRQCRHRVTCIAFEKACSATAMADAVNETIALRQTGEMSWCIGYGRELCLSRYTMQHTPLPRDAPERTENAPSSSRLLWLVTGGTGDVCRDLLPFMFSKDKVSGLALIGRSDYASAQQRILELKDRCQGIQISYHKVSDASSRSELQKIIADIEQRQGTISGVLHAAGTLHPALFKDVTEEQIRSSFHSKVSVSWNLHEVFASRKLEYFWMLSSFASVVGMPSLAGYTIANQFIDALARLRRVYSLSANSIQLGGWGGSKMSDKVHEMMRTPHPDMQPLLACQQMWNALIPNDRSPPVLTIATLNTQTPSAAALAQDTAFLALMQRLSDRQNKQQRVHLSRSPRTLDENSSRPVTSSHNSQLPDSRRETSTEATQAAGDTAPASCTDKTVDVATLRQNDQQSSDSSREMSQAPVIRGHSVTRVAQLVADILRLDTASAIDSNTPLGEYGWDSLYHTELQGLIRQRFSQKMSMELTQDEITIAKIVQTLESI